MALGLAKSTVARALNGRGRVAKATRLRVQRLAKEMGYRPDPGLSMIALSRWKRSSSQSAWTLGMLWSRPLGDALRDRLKSRVNAMGCTLDYLHLPEFESALSMARVMDARGWRGVLIGPLPRPELARRLEIDWQRYSVLCCGFGRVRLPFDVVHFHHFANVRMAWKRLQENGARRIAPLLLRHDPMAEDDVAREAGVRFELAQLPTQHRIPIKWIRSGEEPGLGDWVRARGADAVLAFPQTVARQLKREGIDIPGEVQIATLQTSDHASCPGILCDQETLIAEAIELLAGKLRAGILGRPLEPKEMLIMGKWIEGEPQSQSL